MLFRSLGDVRGNHFAGLLLAVLAAGFFSALAAGFFSALAADFFSVLAAGFFSALGADFFTAFQTHFLRLLLSAKHVFVSNNTVIGERQAPS